MVKVSEKKSMLENFRANALKLYKLILTFKFVVETLVCDNSNDNSNVFYSFRN